MGDKIKAKRKNLFSFNEKEDVIRLFKNGAKVKDLAKQFSVSRQTIYNTVAFLGKASDRSEKVHFRVHPLELRAFDKVLADHGIENRSHGLRKLVRFFSGFFEERDDIAEEWRKIRRQMDAIGNNTNQIAHNCNRGLPVGAEDFSENYKELSRQYFELSQVLNILYNAVDKQALLDNQLKNMLNEG